MMTAIARPTEATVLQNATATDEKIVTQQLDVSLSLWHSYAHYDGISWWLPV